MAPIVHGLEAEYAGKVRFTYLDIDDRLSDKLKSALGYRAQPHFFLLDEQGEIIAQWLGFVDADTFRAAINTGLVE